MTLSLYEHAAELQTSAAECRDNTEDQKTHYPKQHNSSMLDYE